jgi:hypothetical protein
MENINMDKFGWERDKNHTWYNQWDFKTPRSYKERYGVDYKKDGNDAYNEEKFTHKLIIVVLCVLALSYVGVIKWI